MVRSQSLTITVNPVAGNNRLVFVQQNTINAFGGAVVYRNADVSSITGTLFVKVLNSAGQTVLITQSSPVTLLPTQYGIFNFTFSPSLASGAYTLTLFCLDQTGTAASVSTPLTLTL